MTKPTHPRAAILHRLATIVASIEAQQADQPGWNADISAAIVNTELKLIEEESTRA